MPAPWKRIQPRGRDPMTSTIRQQPGKFAIAERPNPAAEPDQRAAAFEEYERNPSRILRIVIDAGGEERGRGV